MKILILIENGKVNKSWRGFLSGENDRRVCDLKELFDGWVAINCSGEKSEIRALLVKRLKCLVLNREKKVDQVGMLWLQKKETPAGRGQGGNRKRTLDRGPDVMERTGSKLWPQNTKIGDITTPFGWWGCGKREIRRRGTGWVEEEGVGSSGL